MNHAEIQALADARAQGGDSAMFDLSELSGLCGRRDLRFIDLRRAGDDLRLLAGPR